MKLRLLKKSEAKKAASIVGRNYSKKWERSSTLEIKEMFGKSPIRPVYFVAEEGNKIIGFAGYTQSWMDYNAYEIFWVNVLPERHKQGIGKKLVAKLIGEIKKKKNSYLILLSANVPNSKYYKDKFGFKTIEMTGKDHYLMALRAK